MADVTGPISTLPGHFSTSPVGMTCDDHPDRPAVKRVQGETDSFGSEQIDMCQECLDKFHAYRESVRQERETTPRCCDWCNSMKLGVAQHRDLDEGSCGRLYNVCRDCRLEERRRAAQELDDYGY